MTPYGLYAAVFLTRAHTRLFLEAFADPSGSQVPHPLWRAIQQVHHQTDRILAEAHIANAA